MIIIRAKGRRDVKALRQLASELQATSMPTLATDIAVQEAGSALQRRGRKPSVSVLPAAVVSAHTQAALLDLKPVEIEKTGEYDLR